MLTGRKRKMTLLFEGVIKDEKGQGEKNKRNKGRKKLDFWMYICALQVCLSSLRWILFLIMPCYFFLSTTAFFHVSVFLFCSKSLQWLPNWSSSCRADLSHFNTVIHGCSGVCCRLTHIAKFRPWYCDDSVFRLAMKRCFMNWYFETSKYRFSQKVFTFYSCFGRTL